MSWPQTCLHRPPRHKQHLLCTHAASSLPAQHPRMLTSPSAERSLLPSATVPGHPDSPWHRGLCREAAAGRQGLEDCTSWHRGMLLTAGVCLGGFGMENFGGLSPTHCASLINPSSLFTGTANCKFKCAITPDPYPASPPKPAPQVPGSMLSHIPANIHRRTHTPKITQQCKQAQCSPE